MKLICTKFGLLYHNTCLWNSKCLFFYEYFAFSVLKSCRITENFDILRFISAIQQTDRIIMTVILQTRQASRHFTIQKFCKNIQKRKPSAKRTGNDQKRTRPKRRPPPNCFGGGLLQPSAAHANTCILRRIVRRSHQNRRTIKPHYQNKKLPSRSGAKFQYNQPSIRKIVVNPRFFDQVCMCILAG